MRRLPVRAFLEPSDSPRNDGEVPPNGGEMPAQSEVSGEGEGEYVIETNTSRDSGEPSLPPPTDLAIRQITGTHFDLTREQPNDKAVEMYRDLIEKFGPEIVRRAQYNLGPSKGYGFVGKVKAECKRVAA